MLPGNKQHVVGQHVVGQHVAWCKRGLQQHATRLSLTVKVGFHYPSSRAEFTGRVDGPRTRVHFLTPVNSARELG